MLSLLALVLRCCHLLYRMAYNGISPKIWNRILLAQKLQTSKPRKRVDSFKVLVLSHLFMARAVKSDASSPHTLSKYLISYQSA